MFTLSLSTSGYEWRCSIGECQAAGHGTNAMETAGDAVRHRDEFHPEMIWSNPRQEAATYLLGWLKECGVDERHVSNPEAMTVVGKLAEILGREIRADQLLPSLFEMANRGKNPMTMDTMQDPRLIELPKHVGPTRNWTTNHQVRWAVGESIQMPPEGMGCKETGARVGEDREVCALPRHNAANIAHAFAIGERVTRIACN
jgi:hypothetical protein